MLMFHAFKHVNLKLLKIDDKPDGLISDHIRMNIVWSETTQGKSITQTVIMTAAEATALADSLRHAVASRNRQLK